MKYKYQAYVKIKDKNTFIEKVNKLNYKVIESFSEESKDEIYAINSIVDNTILLTDNKPEISDFIDCKDMEHAFLGIVAIRDDSDIYQYFVNEEGASWINLGMWIEPGSLEFCLTDKKVKCFNSPKTHKASPEEILNYFRKQKHNQLGL